MQKTKQKQKKLQKSESQLNFTENIYFNYGLLVVFLVLVFFASSYKISGDDDFFWHLATGRYIIQNQNVPDKDIFGHITSGTEWIPFEWGWDVLSYSLYLIGGYNAVMIFRSLAFCLIFLLYYLLLKKFKVNSLLSILFLFILLISIMDRLSPRPHIITYLFFVTVLFILLNFKYLERDNYSKKIYFLPLIFLIWANFHMGVLAGGLILFVFTFTETLIYLYPKKFASDKILPLSSSEFKKLWIISFLCLIALLLNPHGLHTYIYAYEHTKLKMLETVNEWQNPFSSKLDFGFIITLYKIYLFSGIIVLYYAYKNKDLFFAFITIAFAIYSVRAIRFTVDYEIIMTFFIVISFSYIFSQINNFTFKKILSANFSKSVLAVFFIYIISQLPSNNIYSTIQYYRVFGWGINDDFIPVQLFDFMKENNISGTPFNHFGTGGFLIWNFPNEKNFIDSRNLNDEIFYEYNSIMIMQPGFEKKLEDRNIDYVIFLDPDLIRRPNDLQRLITKYLNTNENWKLVFWDDKSMLFLKNIPKYSEIINKYHYKVINPYTAMFNKNEFETNVKTFPDIAKSELNRKQTTEPEGFLFKGIYQLVNNILKGL